MFGKSEPYQTIEHNLRAKETSTMYYKRLIKDFDHKLDHCLNHLRAQLDLKNATEEKNQAKAAVEAYQAQASNLRNALNNSWAKIGHSDKSGVKPGLQEGYILETLVRAGKAFDDPLDTENNKQIVLLGQKIPGKTSVVLAILAVALLTFAIVAALTIGILLAGPTAGGSLIIGIESAVILGVVAGGVAYSGYQASYSAEYKQALSKLSSAAGDVPKDFFVGKAEAPSSTSSSASEDDNDIEMVSVVPNKP